VIGLAIGRSGQAHELQLGAIAEARDVVVREQQLDATARGYEQMVAGEEGLVGLDVRSLAGAGLDQIGRAVDHAHEAVRALVGLGRLRRQCGWHYQKHHRSNQARADEVGNSGLHDTLPQFNLAARARREYSRIYCRVALTFQWLARSGSMLDDPARNGNPRTQEGR